MSDELRRALDDLVQGVADEQDARTRAGDGLPVAAMTSRARRGRVRHVALVSAVTACAVLGVAAGGVAVAVWERPEPAPAAPPTESADPTPTAAPSAAAPSPTEDATTAPSVTLPDGDASLPFGACGSLMASPTDPPRAVGVTPEVSAVPSTVPRGAPVEVRTTSTASGDVGAVLPSSGPRIVFARDGVVVGTADTYPAGSTVDTVTFVYDDPSYPSTSVFVSHVAPTVCEAPGSTAGAPLPAGDYQVVALTEAWTTPADDLMTLLSDADWTVDDVAEYLPLDHRSAVSSPADLRIEARDVDPGTLAQPPTGPTTLDGEGFTWAPYEYPDPCSPDSGVGSGTGILTVTGPTGTVTAGADVDVRTTYAGSGRLTLQRATALRLVRDGVVVAQTETGFAREDVDHGTTLASAVSTTTGRTCAEGATAAMDVAVPAGTYSAYPVVVVVAEGLVGPDGTDVLPRGGDGIVHQIAGEPFTLVVP